MNTHDIELPPLPEARIVSYQTDSTMRRMELRTHSDEDMRYFARQAIEADRKRRGEPVYQVNMKGNGWEDCTLDRYESAGRVIEQDAQRGWKRWERRVLWSAPQPAEPDAATIADYEAVLADHRRLVRELDVLLNGEEGAAEQASLCDIVAQVRREGIKSAEPRLDAPAQVGHTRFGEGVPWSTVIGAAQRYHAVQNTPAKEQERLQRAAENIKALHQAEPVKVPSPVEIKALAEEHLSVEDVPGYGPTVSGEGEFARALLARYGNNPGAAHE